jgi:tRNA-Thr(GGU) m(6)t(6)A37 methyltransferase TsaA
MGRDGLPLPDRRDPVSLAAWLIDTAARDDAAVGGIAGIASAATELASYGLSPELVERARLLAVGAYHDGRGDGLEGAALRLARARGTLEPARRTEPPPGRRFRHIGVVRSPFSSLDGMPLQTVAASDVRGRVELDDEFAPATRDLAGFSHVWLLCDLHLSSGYEPEVVPFLDDRPRSVFATRSPRRPNAIGLSLVRLLAVDGPRLEVAELDLVDGTPVLDLKPYVPLFDSRETDRVGWFAAAGPRVFEIRSDQRYDPQRDDAADR